MSSKPRYSRKQKAKMRIAFLISILIIIFALITFGVFFIIKNYNSDNKLQSTATNDVTQNANNNTSNFPNQNKNAKPKYEDSEISKYFTTTELKEALEDPFLKLINKKNPLGSDYKPKTVAAKGVYLDERVAPHFIDMLTAAKADGYTKLVAYSGYRSYDRQVFLYNRKVNYYKNEKGYPEDKAKIEAATVVAVPGESEHQYGMSADVCDSTYGKLDEGFANTSTYDWLKNNAHKFGFILRYPEDKIDITEYIYEAWHYRYVGEKHAKIIHEKGWCLEEYHDWLNENAKKYLGEHYA